MGKIKAVEYLFSLFVIALLVQITEGSGKAIVHFLDYQNPLSTKLNGECCKARPNHQETSLRTPTNLPDESGVNNNTITKSTPLSLVKENKTVHQSRSPRSALAKPPRTKEASQRHESNLGSIKQQHCTSACHNVFYLCISDITGKPPCDMVQLDSRRIDSDDIEFSGDERDTRMAYPFNYTFYKWSGQIELDVIVLDGAKHAKDLSYTISSNNVKTINMTDTIATFYMRRQISAYSKDEESWIKTQLVSHNNKTLDLRIKVYCDPGYYPPDCERKYCVPVNNEKGHYNCTHLGDKQCLPGWSNMTSNCTIRYCKPTNDSINGHYACSENGTKICLPGWIKPESNCIIKLCQPSNDTNGNFVCDRKGNKVCLPGWENTSKNCTIRYCEPRDDKSGHYNCGEKGEKLCLIGWENPDRNCTIHFCQPQNDLLGHYKCSEKGEKICLAGWTDLDSDCTVKVCEPRDDEYGHYYCDDIGDKVCLNGWLNTTLNCLVKTCTPKNDFTGHYKCSEMGDKICLDGYVNPSLNCTIKECHPQNDDENGHYSCSKTGIKMCMGGWTNEGLNCTVRFCEAQNSTDKGHYVCDEKGKKICLEGWMDEESNCTIKEELPPFKYNRKPSLKRSTSVDKEHPAAYYAFISVPIIVIIAVIVALSRIRGAKYDKFENPQDGFPMQQTSMTLDTADISIYGSNRYQYRDHYSDTNYLVESL
ncbi:delta-like protein B [Clytia hemisphaerica]|uniref:DSL domain-containing protein n=1 Tax=Clytia hemisphaerica TaxID=252671 RepID=A0A7M5UX73_9CNID